MEKTVEIEVIKIVLMLYGFDVAITEQKSYIMLSKIMAEADLPCHFVKCSSSLPI